MDKIKDYLFANFTKTFVMLFLPFFSIISLVYFIKISMLTGQIQLDFLDVLKLYGYFLPSITSYTIPVSFVASLSLTLIKLSSDNELTALYSFGQSSSLLIRKFLPLGLLFSILLLLISFFAMPTTDQLYNNFKSQKLSDAKFNVDTGSLGQNIKGYHIFINTQDNKNLYNIAIYNPSQTKGDDIFLAKKGKIVNGIAEKSYIELDDGYAYRYKKDNLKQIKFNTLKAYDTSKSKNIQFQNIFDYWKQIAQNKKDSQKIFFLLFLSLMPLLALHLTAAFSMINPRYQSNNSYIAIFLISLAFYIYATLLNKYGNLYILLFGIVTFVVVGRILFAIKVKKVF